jgi:hypothetical protein
VLNPPPIPSLHAISIGHDNKPTPEAQSPKPTQTQQTSKKSTSKDSTTTSTSSCSQTTTTGCFTSCADGGSTTSCLTTCSTVSGCSVTVMNSAITSECQLPSHSCINNNASKLHRSSVHDCKQHDFSTRCFSFDHSTKHRLTNFVTNTKSFA